jgi:hypothetical protein
MTSPLVLLAAWTLLPVGTFCGLLGWYFAWKFFTLYLPNKADVDACIPSGGTCSIDGMANLELSGPMTALWLGLAAACFMGAFLLLRGARRPVR